MNAAKISFLYHVTSTETQLISGSHPEPEDGVEHPGQRALQVGLPAPERVPRARGSMDVLLHRKVGLQIKPYSMTNRGHYSKILVADTICS